MNHDRVPFLQRVAAELANAIAPPPKRGCVVLPGRRPVLYLREYLASLIKHPVILPEMLSIEDFVYKLTGFTKADPLTLLVSLFKAVRKTNPDNNITLDEFLKWGQVLLDDFEEIDFHLIEPKEIFSFLTETKAIEQWNPEGSKLTPRQQNHLAFYRALSSIYQHFTDNLINQNLAYDGLAFRSLAKTIQEQDVINHWNFVWFVGFNAFTPAEEKILEGMQMVTTIRLFFDADNYYLDDDIQEAGRHIRKWFHKSDKRNFCLLSNNLLESKKRISVLGTSGNTAQVQVVPSFIESIASSIDISRNTAIVLNDEKLLIPLLYNLPASIGDFNVTMGYPIKHTLAYQWVDYHILIFRRAVEQQMQGGVAGSKQRWMYYSRDINRLMSHPYTLMLGEHVKPGFDKKVNQLRELSSVFQDKDSLALHFDSQSEPGLDRLLQLLFAGNQGVKHLLQAQQTLLSMLLDNLFNNPAKRQYAFEIEFISCLLNSLNKLSHSLGNLLNDISITAYQSLFVSLAGQMKVPFTGEPLQGLQIMGMLETRLLDFKNILMLSVNEGVLPSSKLNATFIPYDIRHTFGLPEPIEKESVFAYHFYRLLQRAENIWLVYNTLTDEMGGGEPSRFLMQIKHELIKRNASVHFDEKLVVPAVKSEITDNKIVIPKNSTVLNKLKLLAQSGLSPSAITSYLKCRLQFYFRFIAGIKERPDTLESMDVATLGSAVHLALKNLYTPYIGKILTPSLLESMIGDYEHVAYQAFNNVFPNGDLRYGRNHLMCKVGNTFIRRYIRYEQNLLKQSPEPLVLLHLEYEFPDLSSHRIAVNCMGEQVKVRIKGIADRIDRWGNQLRIIDFKTEKVERNKLVINDWDDSELGLKKDKALQLIIYGWLYARSFSTGLPSTGIISFRALKDGFMHAVIPPTSNPAEEVEQFLTRVITELFNKDQPFDQTTNETTCRYCIYRSACNR